MRLENGPPVDSRTEPTNRRPGNPPPPDLQQLVVTDTIPLHEAARGCSKIKVVSIANLVGEASRRITNEESVSSLFV